MSAQGGGQAGTSPTPDLAAAWNPAAGGGSSAGTLSRSSPQTGPVVYSRDGAILRRLWSKQEEALLREWVVQRVPSSEIGRRLGRSIRSVEAKRIELPERIQRRRTAEELRVTVRMVVAGKKESEIARALGRKVSTVRYWISEIRKRLRERGEL